MPVPIPQGGIVQVRLQGTLEGQKVQNVLYFRAQAADTDAIAHLLAEIVECLITALIPGLSAAYAFERAVGMLVSPTHGVEFEYVPAVLADGVGDLAGDALPSYSSALISLRTGFGGRSGRGRMYIAGVAESSTTGSYIKPDDALLTGMVAFAACMLGKFFTRDVAAAGNYEWGVMSRKLGGATIPYADAGFHTVLSATPDRLLATTRSRKQGRGM
jgi:hypothetical protein